MRRLLGRRVAAGVLVGLVMPLAGCGSDGAAPAASLAPLTGTVAPSPTPDVMSTLPAGSGTRGLTAPEPDPLISHPTAAGAEAAVRHYFAALDYAFATGDVVPLREVSGAECVSCGGEIARVNRVYAEGGWMSGGPSAVKSLSTSRVADGVDTTLVVKADVNASRLTEFDRSGSIVTAYPGIDIQTYQVAVSWVATQWRVLEYSGVAP